jgi:bacillithiol biosynthesis deacetylase BshB1
MKLDILAFGAHPDDVELGCSGTIAKEISLGKKVGIIDLTRGELGTRGSVEIRNQEAAASAKILGVSVRENLDMRDGFFINDEVHQLKVIKMIRKYRPEIVICNAIEDRHIDHGKGSKLVSDACFLSGLMRIETEIDEIKQEAWRPKLVYHYIQWNNLTPDFTVDISGVEVVFILENTIDLKIEIEVERPKKFWEKLKDILFRKSSVSTVKY